MAKPTKKQRLLFAVFKDQMRLYSEANNIDDPIYNKINKGTGDSLLKGNLELKMQPEHCTRVYHILEEILQLAKDIEKN